MEGAEAGLWLVVKCVLQAEPVELFAQQHVIGTVGVHHTARIKPLICFPFVFWTEIDCCEFHVPFLSCQM